MSPALPRHLHPVAWWVWALGVAVAASLTTNPLLLLLALAVVTLVVMSRRGDAPWSRAFRLYVALGGFIVLSRVVLHLLVGLKTGDHVLFWLPSVRLPSWAAGIEIGGSVRLEGLLGALVLGLRLATMIVCIGAANALANPKRMLRALPVALHEIGTAVVVSVTVAPQLATSVQRVLRARRLRGQGTGGLRSVRQVALPVLQDTLDRSLALASAMDSRGYGRRVEVGRGTRRWAAAASLAGLLGACIGTYGVLTTDTSAIAAGPMLALGVVLAVVGLRLGGRGIRRTLYRPDPWLWPETLTAASGVLAAVAMVLASELLPDDMVLPLAPLGYPTLPWPAVLGLLVAAAPAVLTPAAPRDARVEAPRALELVA